MLQRMGFQDKWIKGFLASSKVSILVNGSPTNEFVVSKGLRQGGPLAPFFFTIVAKGLCGMMREAFWKNIFSCFKVEDGEV